MVGRDPHRPQGKVKTDEEHFAATEERGLPHVSPSRKEVHEQNMVNRDRTGAPTRFPAEEQLGGSRPGVPSRVKDAIERREEQAEQGE